MSIFSIFTLCGGLAFFLYGMQVMSGGLENVAGGKLEKLLREMTSNPMKSLALGAGITIAIQSSSALTVMLVGLVNSGIMDLGQTIGVIMGSNIGTTLTAWILSLAGIESDNFFLQLLKPESFSPIFALVGICMMMVSKSVKKRSVGSIFVGFAILMFGMQLMTNAMTPLADNSDFTKVLTAFTNPILGVIVGALFTGIIQSSAASVGILQALSLTGSLSYGMAVPIIMGQNIGTCVTAIISSVGVSTNAKRVAVIHITFNILGVVIFLPVFYGLNYLLHLGLVEMTINPVGIALAHTIFNLATTICLLPFGKFIENVARKAIKDKANEPAKDDKTAVFIDERILLSPSFAVSECTHHSVAMADLAEDILFDSINMLKEYSATKAQDIFTAEEKLDNYEDKLGTFLVKLSGTELSERDANEISKLLHSLSDFERIGDHALSITYVAKEMHEKNLHFSPDAMDELNVLQDALHEIIELTRESFETGDMNSATKVEPLEQVIDGMVLEIKNRHIKRLQDGICTIELGFKLSDLLNCYQRVSDHCSNIAACVIQLKSSQLDMHNYLNAIKTGEDEEFTREFNKYQDKYKLKEEVAM